MSTSPKVLFWDIETSLQPVAVFQLAHNDWINPENIVEERYIICGSWKWADSDKVHAVSVLNDVERYAKDPHDDKHVVEALHAVLSQADVIVHHNGDSFDKRYLETRALFHKLSPLPPTPTVDTYKVAKSRLMLNSNKLDYIGGLLGLGKKIKTSHGLWLRVMNGEKAAVREMVEYNKQDVLLLEKVYEKLKPYMNSLTNLELFGASEGCPRCGSKKVQRRGLHRAISRVYQRFQCLGCGGWFRAFVNEKDVSTTTRVL